MPNLYNSFEEKRVALKGNESQSAAEEIGEETAITDALDSPTQPTPPTSMLTSAAPDPLFSIQTPDLLTRVIGENMTVEPRPLSFCVFQCPLLQGVR